MNSNLQKIQEILIKRGNELLNQPKSDIVKFSGNIDADKLVNDFKKFPHAYVFGCVMDRQMKSERAWLIPFIISQELGGFEFEKLLKLSLEEIKNIFKTKNLHRFNDIMAKSFYEAVKQIHEKYNDDASLIWKDNPKSATVVLRFLEFKGVGIKIASMAANLLARDFKIPLEDHICIDISPDTHVKRVLKRLGLVSKNADAIEVTYKAREIYPEYPGILDNSCFEVGRTWCKPRKPLCNQCYLNEYCPKIVN